MLYILTLGTDQAYRRTGIAKGLLDSCIAYAQQVSDQGREVRLVLELGLGLGLGLRLGLGLGLDLGLGLGLGLWLGHHSPLGHNPLKHQLTC